MDYSLVKAYYNLTKPGIIYGNLVSFLSGFAFSGIQSHSFRLGVLIMSVIGTSLVIASACVINNILDRNIDKKMKRTKKRAVVSGQIPIRNAAIFASILAIIGLILLYVVSTLILLIGLFGAFIYVSLYTNLKKKGYFATFIGAFSGSTPIMAGYIATRHNINLTAIYLFILMIAWQMVHFYSIAIYRLEDYTEANIPLLAVKYGVKLTKYAMLPYLILFYLMSVLIFTHDHLNYIFLVVMTIISVYWLMQYLSDKITNNDRLWAKKLFLFSLIALLTMSIALPIGAIK